MSWCKFCKTVHPKDQHTRPLPIKPGDSPASVMPAVKKVEPARDEPELNMEPRVVEQVPLSTVAGLSQPDPIPMLLWCPGCHARHIDRGEFGLKPHRTHACQKCGMVWRPALVPTVGVEFLPGHKD